MSESRVLLLALLTAIGCRVGIGLGERLPARSQFGVLSGLAILGLALWLAIVANRQLLVISVVLTSAVLLGTSAGQAYRPLSSQIYSGTAKLVTDPKPTTNGWRAEVRLASGKRLILNGAGFAADPLRVATAGMSVQIEGTIRPILPSSWSRSRHLVGRLSLTEVSVVSGPPFYQRPSEWLRSVVISGADLVDPGTRNLYLGLVIGDDRFQPLSQRAQFRQAGLSHLLAVSGQNVAFVLLVLGPLLRRLGLTGRLGLTFLALGVFALATRLEPSVLRATATAGIAAWSVAIGRRSRGLRTLGLAVTVLILIDPMLVYSVGFILSVSASLGILLLGPSIVRRLALPRWIAEPLAVTLAAQLGVAPLLIAVFGPLSLVSVPANVMAGWAAGAVMTLGLTSGVVAGFLPTSLGRLVQFPAGLLVEWIARVAALGSRLPAPALGPAAAIVLLAGCITIWHVRGRQTLFASFIRSVAVIGLGLLWITNVPNPPQERALLRGGGQWWPPTTQTPSVLIVSSVADGRLVDSLVQQRVLTIDLVVLERGSRSNGALLGQLGEVAGLGLVVAPPDHRAIGATRLKKPIQIRVGQEQWLEIRPGDGGLSVELRQP